MLDYSRSFIETQFPVSKISKESYKERKAGSSQTLTGLGKWWGRKPLILVRATLLGILLPVSDNPAKDRNIFLKILTMDNEGLWLRKNKNISIKDIFNRLNPKERKQYFTEDSSANKPIYIIGIKQEDKEYLQKLVFNRFSYDEKLEYCERPENVSINNKKEVWEEINNHLDTNAFSLDELIKQLGEKRYGHVPKVGDCFAGGGSIPFESARIGAEVYASDLNPIASLLTWASLNIIGTSKEEAEELQKFQQRVFDAVDNQITTWGIEHNEKGWRANAYLYCNETICPECGYRVPLLPSMIIGTKSKTILKLHTNDIDKSFEFEVIQNADEAEFEKAEGFATLRKYALNCPHCNKQTPIPSIRKDMDDGVSRPYRYNTPNDLRKWELDDVVPKENDILTERLYCIRYEQTIVDEKGKETVIRHYVTPTKEDYQREEKVLSILLKKQTEWLQNGYLPKAKIEEGWNTNQVIYEKGWTYWKHLYNPRQLLQFGLLMEKAVEMSKNDKEKALTLLGINKCVNWNSKLSIWHTDDTHNSEQLFYNQAFNTLFNYCCRAFIPLRDIWIVGFKQEEFNCINSNIKLKDARQVNDVLDIWITDPPYADAVHYHELTELFLAWDTKLIHDVFPNWYHDSKRVLAIKEQGQSFNESMIEVYSNLAKNMPENGTQLVMFTHQDVKVWSELAMILWSAGLRVVSAWNIATETESGGLKSGNYVKGTVLLTLKKQTSNEMAFQDELYDEIKREVEKIIDSMRDLDDKDDPDFTDADYLLASYASSLKVLTAYKEIDGIDVPYWLSQPRNSSEENPIEALINKAVKIAYDYLIPEGFDKSYWKDLTPDERFYIRGIELEMNGSYKISSYQELARGFGVKDYTDMFAEFKANSTRLKTPSEFKMKNLGNGGFSSSVVRHLLVAINECTVSKSTVEGRSYLKSVYQENNEFWYKKPLMIEVLNFISRLEHVENMEHWHEHAYFAKVLKEALKNEGV